MNCGNPACGEERRHCATFHGLQRAVGAVRVAGGDAALSQPRNLGVELVAVLHIAKAGRSDVLGLLLLDVQHLGAVALGAVGAGGRRCRCAGVAAAPWRGYRSPSAGIASAGSAPSEGGGGGIRVEASHGGGIAAEPQLGAEGRYLIQPVSLTLPHSYWVVALTRYWMSGLFALVRPRSLRGALMMRVLVSIMLVSTSPQAPLSG